jgi:hypothetical protein
LFASLGAVNAQPAEPGPLVSIGEDLWRSGISCWNCHGNLASGDPEDPRSPRGANLRESALTVEQLAEVIRCGRPGTAMPSFGRNPYAGQNPCYGLTAEQIGAQLPPVGDPTLNARQTDALAQFIAFRFAGKGPVTREECREFFGENASTCARWPTAGGEPGVAAPAGGGGQHP